MRKLARETVFKVIYKSLFLNGDLSSDEIIEEEGITLELDKDFEEDKKFIDELLSLYQQNKTEIDNKINGCLKNFEPNRVFKIDRAILSCCITEILFYKIYTYNMNIDFTCF